MKAIPVDDRRMQLTVAVPPRQQSRPNPITGEVMWDVDLFVLADDRPEVVRVMVPESGLAKDLTPGGVVQTAGLTLIAWEKEGRHGQMFRCDAIRLVPSGGLSKSAAA